MASTSPLAFVRQQMQALLRADPTLVALVATVPGSNPVMPAIYLNHISFIRKLSYPAIFIYPQGGGRDEQVLFAKDYIFGLDVWTEETTTNGLGVGSTGAWEIFDRANDLLHMCHLNHALSAPGIRVHEVIAVPDSNHEDFDLEQKLYHVIGAFRVRFSAAGSEVTVPN